jgi:2-amino-4-hydroxy-6-hydroxymethyldihydropteridine diphosphokinase
LALGSNLDGPVGDRHVSLDAAIAQIAHLPQTRLLACSSVIETKPWGPVPQGDYLNAACLVETTLTPHALLVLLHTIERSLGRDRSHETRFGPRTLDLDIVLFADLILSDPDLIIPHPRMHERAFVLGPLAQIAPAMLHPTLRRTVLQLFEGITPR